MHAKLRKALDAAGLEPEYQLGENYRCPCPSCGSHDNLNVRWNESLGRVQAYCWSCGSTSLKAIDGSNLITKRERKESKPVSSTFNADAKLVRIYEYTDADGKVWLRKLRYEPARMAKLPDGSFAKKDFVISYRREIIAKNTGNRFSAWGARPKDFSQYYIYAYPRVLAAIAKGEYIFLVDGEKDADVFNARETYGAATCLPFGDRTITDWAVKQLSEAKIVVVADRDSTGYRSALAKARALPGQVYTFVEADTGKDTYDHYAAGGTYRTMVRIPVATLVERTK